MAKNYDYKTLLEDALTRVPEGYDKREGSVLFTTLAPVCFELSRSYWLLTWLMNLFLPDTAQQDWLDRCVGQFGLQRKLATKTLRRLETKDSQDNYLDVELGSRFRINDLTLITKAKISKGVYEAEAEIAGILGNQYQGDLLPVHNINNLGSAMLGEVILAGTNQEKDDELRERFYNHVRRSPFGGNVADYEEKAMAIEGVGAVHVFPIWNGPGSVLIMIGDDFGRSAMQELVTDVQTIFQPTDNHNAGLAPIGHQVTAKTCENLPVHVTAKLRIKPGESFSILRDKAITEIKNYINSISFQESTVFQSRIAVAALNVSGILDMIEIKINNNTVNFILSKTATSYQVPVVGTITLSELVS